MGYSAEITTCFGVKLKKENQPWLHYLDMDDWMLYGVLKFKPSMEIYTKSGDYVIPKPTREQVKNYYKEITEHILLKRKLKVEFVRHGYEDTSNWILALSDTVVSFYDTSNQINPQGFKITEQQVTDLKNFCNENKVLYTEEPAWYLLAYYG